MTTAALQASDEIQIRQLIDRCAEALRAKDANGVIANYAPDILLFDLAPPLQYRGAEVYRKNLQEWFASFRGAIGFEIRD
jgi:ketosteroid isomerase-like protein